VDAVLRAGDDEQVVLFVWRRWRRIVCARILAWDIPFDEVDDILQDVMALLSRELSFFLGGCLRSWMISLTDYQCRSWLKAAVRARAWQARLRGDRAPQSLYEEERLLALRSDLAVVMEFFAALDSIQRAVFKAVFIEERGIQETVDLLREQHGLQLSEDAVQSRKRRMRARLATRLEELHAAGRREG